MWTRRPSRCDPEFELPSDRTQRARRSGGKSTWSRLCSATALGCAPFLAAAGASAGSVDQPAAAHNTVTEFKLACSRAFEQSQRLRNGSQYLAASGEVLKCANPKCGEALFGECSKIYNDLQSATPSVVFAVHDDSGRELTRVVVTIDGNASPDLLDGKPVRVDPGSHQLAFASDGYKPTVQAVLIRAGEQLRLINAVLQRTPSVQTRQLPPSLPAPTSARESPRTLPLASYVLGAVSVVGLGAFVGFRVAGGSRFDELQRTCKPTCDPSAVDSARQKYTLSDIALGVGVAAAVAAVTVYLLAPREQKLVAALQVSPSEHGLSAGFVGQF